MRRIPGVVIGIVKDLEDPDGQGRIQVEFPWLEEGQNSAWAPVASPLAGKDRGMWFMPELEDEALVCFEQGDFENPYIMGFLWNGVDTPPETTNQNRVIMTPGGHTLRFEDEEGERRIIIRTDGQHHITIDDTDNTITVSDSGGSNEIVIKSDDNQITIKAQSKVVVDCSNIELTAGATEQVPLGNKLVDYINNQIVSMYNSHTHPGQMAAGILPVTPMIPITPLTPAPPTVLSTKVKNS